MHVFFSFVKHVVAITFENVDFLISNRTNSQHGKIDISNKVEKICMVF